MEENHKRTAFHTVLTCFFGAGVVLAIIWCILLIRSGIQQHPRVESDMPDSIAGVPVHTDYIPEDCTARPNRTRKIHYIVIHETDNTGEHATAAAHNEYLHSNCWKEQKSWHYTVDDTEIWHHLPNDEVGYHAGDSSRKEGGNQNGIGIELCVNAGGDFEQTMRNAAQLTAYLLLRYNKSLDAVKQHQDFSGKICPATIITENRWGDFLEMVQEAYDTQAEDLQEDLQNDE